MMNFKSLYVTPIYFLFYVCLIGYSLEAISQSPTSQTETAETYLYRGIVNAASDNHEEAINDYNIAIRVHPQLAEKYRDFRIAELINSNSACPKQLM